jgi:hypothetical protein
MNNDDFVIIRQHLENAIHETVKQFQEHPADFLAENDIQAVLFTGLRNAMRDFRLPYEAVCQKDRCFGNDLDVSRVMTEYWLADQGPCDIVVLCSGQDPGAAALWRHPCRIGIEVKLWQPQERHNWNEPRGPQQDIDKLQRYWKMRNGQGQQFTGIAILFRHPGATAFHDRNLNPSEEARMACPEDGVAVHDVSVEEYWWSDAPILAAASVDNALAEPLVRE